MSVIRDTLSSIVVGEGISFRNMTMFPILRMDTVRGDYFMLDEALADDICEVMEVSDSGSVPELQFLNKGGKPVLLVDGEELVGAKQNRILNLSILAPGDQRITIPVSCVEQGRWSYRSSKFHSARRHQYSRGRAAKAEQVSCSMRASGVRRSDQSQLWQDISAKAQRHSVASETDAMSDIFEKEKGRIDEFEPHFPSQPRQVGAIFGIDGTVAGMDLFETPDYLAKILPKLVRSYVLDSIENPTPKETAPRSEEAAHFLEAVCTAKFDEFPAVGMGNDLRIDSAMISGGALVLEDRILHLGVFRTGPEALIAQQ